MLRSRIATGGVRQVFLFSEEPGVNGTDERGGVFHGAEIRFVFFAQDELVGWDEKALSLDMVSCTHQSI